MLNCIHLSNEITLQTCIEISHGITEVLTSVSKVKTSFILQNPHIGFPLHVYTLHKM